MCVPIFFHYVSSAPLADAVEEMMTVDAKMGAGAKARRSSVDGEEGEGGRPKVRRTLMASACGFEGENTSQLS